MSAFILLNGVELDALSTSPGDEQENEIGEGLARAYDGTVLRSNRGFKRVWSLTANWDTPTNSRAFRKYLQGRFRNWRFDSDLNSTSGLAPTSSSGATIVAGGLFGSCLQLAATTGTITYAGLGGVSLVDGFTLLIQQFNGSTWDDYHLSWDKTGALSAVYKNGVQQATSLPSWISSYTHSTGTLVLVNTTGSAVKYDEMVALQFEAPLSSWSSQWDTWRNTNTWGALPFVLNLGGGASPSLLDTTAIVAGKPSKARMQPAVINGTLVDNAESFPFELWEA